jgi:hypothetical protein
MLAAGGRKSRLRCTSVMRAGNHIRRAVRGGGLGGEVVGGRHGGWGSTEAAERQGVRSPVSRAPLRLVVVASELRAAGEDDIGFCLYMQ